MKKRTRILSLLLALLFLVPSLLFVSSAEQTDFANQSFNDLTANRAVTEADGFVSVPIHQTVMGEGNERFLRIPFVGSYAKDDAGKETVTGNCDAALQIDHTALNSGDGFTIEVDYRPHYNGSGSAMVEASFAKYTFTTAGGVVMQDAGINLALFSINLKDGSLVNCGTVVSGAQGMKLDQWNKLRLSYHPAKGTYEIYINGALYARQKNTPKMQTETQAYINCKDVKLSADQIVLARCGKSVDGYTATDLGANTSYVDIDNIRVYSSREATIILDGKETVVDLDIGLDLTQHEKKLLYAEVTKPGQSTVYTQQTSFDVVDGTVINTRYVGLDPIVGQRTVRTSERIGLRFLTALNAKDYDEIKKDKNVKDLKIGTVILPLDMLSQETITTEYLDTVNHLDIPFPEGAWYDYNMRYCHTFAGSIVDIKEGNSNRAFVGVGYVQVTLPNGKKLTVFSENNREKAVSSIMSIAADEEIRGNTSLSAGVRLELEKYAGVAAMELKGLNVLAIGDSLFQGARNGDGYNQWINMLGRRYEWNLTNLGVGGATITTKTAGIEHTNFSMYDALMNTPEKYKFGSTRKDEPRYYTCGNPSGVAADVDLILLLSGSNDYGEKVQAPLGEIGSSDPEEFLGAWRLMVDKLLEMYPNATVVMMTAWENIDQERTDGAKSIEYTSSVVDLYEALYKNNDRVRMINSGDPDVSGVNMLDSVFRAKYSFDRHHLNDVGMNMMASAMLPYLKEIVAERMERQATALEGMDVLAIGDSLFGGHTLADGEQWLEILAKRCSWNLTNLGTNGWTVAKNDAAYPEGAKIRTSMYDKLMNDPNYKFGTTAKNYYKYGDFTNKTAADVDVVFLEGGWNDFGWNLPLGTVNDTDGSTYMGAVNAMVKKLLELYPNAKVVLITSWHVEESKNGRDRMDFVANGMKQIYSTHYASNDRVVLLDAGDPDLTGIHMMDAAWKKVYAIDSAHLNADGMRLMADRMQKLIWQYVLDKS